MKHETIVAASLVALAIVAAGAMNRYSVTSGTDGAAWRVDGLTGEVRVCRDYGSTHESLCENPAQFRDPNVRASGTD